MEGKLRELAIKVGFSSSVRIKVVSERVAIARVSPIGPTLYLSKKLLDTLSREELEAILYHELAHYKLRHWLTLPGIAILWALTSLWLYHFWIFAPVLIGMIAIISIISIAKAQELEADLWAYCYAGEDLIKALVKLYKVNKWKYRILHPTLEHRLKNLGSFHGEW